MMAVVATMTTMSIFAQSKVVTPYFSTFQLPNLIKCLPAPPDTLSAEFNYDIMQYMWGKEQRLDEKRQAIARRDAVWSFDNLFAEFNVPFGLTISPSETPEIWKLLETSLVTTDQMRVAPKKFYHRKRPYVRFKEHILTYQAEEDEEELGREGSYPSGHTSRGWTTALLLSEIAPSRADTILARGYIYGESRIIVGAHWESDVTASRLGATIGYMRLQTSPAFQEQMKKAQDEYAAKTGIMIAPSSTDGIIREGRDTYYTHDEMPNMLHFLPAPPDTIGNKFTRDIMRYMWGKNMRQDAERAQIAYRDISSRMDYICEEFSEPFGLTLSKERTPEIYKLLEDATSTCCSIGSEAKKFYNRKRPFVRFHEHTMKLEGEEKVARTGSYPSGHTILGWSSALLLSEINPAQADTLMARGYMYGDSRVIVGAHWQSDVDAGRLAASAAYVRLHNSARFQEQMNKAKEEFARLSEQPVGEMDMETIDGLSLPKMQQSSARIYQLNGTPATQKTHGVMIEHGNKKIKR